MCSHHGWMETEETWYVINNYIFPIIFSYQCKVLIIRFISMFLGGGFGGKKESGQLRFGGKDRPFKRPIVPNILKSKR